ncbi:MAG: MBL fold metallo-hydrolase [Deltaproteobacteria bacterium]|nr:MBL fold metallo-hydrolase [Deltaproteobacteria bacterium]
MAHPIADRIAWLGHDGFRIDGSLTVYIDPYKISPGPQGDLILITHEHFDHCSPDDVSLIQGPHSVVVTEPLSAQKLSGDVRAVSPGERLELGKASVQAVPSDNTDKAFHPRANNWLGFVLEMDGARIYHAGDADFIPEMADLEVDVALLPVSGTYVMTWEQAVEATRAIRPGLAIPMHYGTVVGDEQDARRFESALRGEIEVRVLSRD